jgi:hypothetical protein
MVSCYLVIIIYALLLSPPIEVVALVFIMRALQISPCTGHSVSGVYPASSYYNLMGAIT